MTEATTYSDALSVTRDLADAIVRAAERQQAGTLAAVEAHLAQGARLTLSIDLLSGDATLWIAPREGEPMPVAQLAEPPQAVSVN